MAVIPEADASGDLFRDVLRRARPVLVALVILSLIGIVAFEIVPEPPPVECAALRAAEEQESRDALAPALEQQVKVDTLAMNGLLEQLAQSSDAELRTELVERVEQAEEDLRIAVTTELEAEAQTEPETEALTDPEDGGASQEDESGDADGETTGDDVGPESADGVAAGVSSEPAAAPTAGDEADETADENATSSEEATEADEMTALEAEVTVKKADLNDLNATQQLIRSVDEAVARVVLNRDALLGLYSESVEARNQTLRELGQAKDSEEPGSAKDQELDERISVEQRLHGAADMAFRRVESQTEDLVERLKKAGIDPPDTETLPFEGSAVNLQVANSIDPLRFDSDRGSKRQEIILSGSDRLVAEQSVTTEDDGRGTEQRLPNKATYVTDIGQLVSDDFDEIARSDVEVWARRVGPDVLLSVCIDPRSELKAGSYKGMAYLVDPSLNTVQIPLEITAQFQWIDSLYFLLLVFPLVAMVYVWYTFNQSSPFKPDALMRWVKNHFVVLYGIGFASVWAALQVAFNNPTWGSSLFSSVAVIGGGLVAAVTAMTTIAGRSGVGDDS